MSTFIGQLIGFVVIVWFLSKYAVPPVRKLMADQKEAVRQQLDDSATATQRLAAADQYHARRVDEGRVEGRRMVDEARSDGVHIAEQLSTQAGVEAERIRIQGGQQVSLLRSQMIRQLQGELGSESVRRATELVKAYVSDPQAQSATVDRFLDELESMSPAAFATQLAPSDLRSASREAQAAMVARFDALSGSLSDEELTKLADELAAVDGLLLREPILARRLSEASGDLDDRRKLLRRVFEGRIGSPTLELLKTAVTVRWSKTDDFLGAIEHVARLSRLTRAEREHLTDEVAEQLFRFGRYLDADPLLIDLLGDSAQPAAERVALLRDILDRATGTNPRVAALLIQTIELLRGQRADEAVADLAALAVSRRGQVVARVWAAAELSDIQRRRLADLLARIYHTPVSVQVTVDPAVLGGLAVAVGDEVIDGSLSSRLTAAATMLPD